MQNNIIQDVEPEFKRPTSVPLYEQETHISFMRDEDFARIYTSDSTQITRLDKLCESNPDMYQLERDEKLSRSYICKDKSMISFRSKKRQISEEQKRAASERFKKYHENKNS